MRDNNEICYENHTTTGRFYSKFTIDGQILGIECNNHPLIFQDVKVWAAMQNTTWGYPVANAKIRNLSINGEKLTIH